MMIEQIPQVVPVTENIFNNIERIVDILCNTTYKTAELDANKIFNIISVIEMNELFLAYGFNAKLLHRVLHILDESGVKENTRLLLLRQIGKMREKTVDTSPLQITSGSTTDNLFNSIEIGKILRGNYSVDKTCFVKYGNDTVTKVIGNVKYVKINNNDINNFLFIDYITETSYACEIYAVFKVYLNIIAKERKNTHNDNYTKDTITLNNIFLQLKNSCVYTKTKQKI